MSCSLFPSKENETTLCNLIPVVLMLTFPQEEFVVYLDTPTESKYESDVIEKEYVSYQDVRLHRWGGSYNNIIQKNTCALDNILLSIFKENITKSYPVIGTTPTEAKFHPFMSLISEYDFDKLRNLITKEIGLQTTHEHFNEYLRFSRPQSNLINYLKNINLCNDKYNTTFHFHLCEKNFNWRCMIGSIGCIITNLEYSICAKLLSSRCQHCQTTITDNFERLSSESISISPLLTIEI